MIKKIILTSLISVIAVGAAVCYFHFIGIYNTDRRSDIICNNVEISLLDSASMNIISKNDILDELSQLNVLGLAIDSINLCNVENTIQNRGEIRDVEAYCDIDGVLHIDALQRGPVARVENILEKYYISEDGYIFPVRCNVDVPIISGYIPTAFGKKTQGYVGSDQEKIWIKAMINLCKSFSHNDFLSKQVEQIYITEKNEINLFLRNSDVKIIFGSPYDYDEKIKKLEAYFKCIVPDKGIDAYSEINLSYKGEIVCK